MALLLMDGFDLYLTGADLISTGKWSVVVGFSTTGGRFGGGAVTVSSVSGNALTFALASVTELWMGFALNSSGNIPLVTLTSALGDEFVLYYNAPGQTISAKRGATTLGTAAVYVPANLWTWVELRFKLHATAGVVEAWINGVQVLNLTAQNTLNNGGATSITSCTLVKGGNIGAAFDDLYVLDTTGPSPLNGRLGDCRIYTAVPTADAGPNNGTLSTGTTHWGVVDEVRYNTTDYTTITNTSGQGEYFTTTSFLGTTQTVYAVKVTTVVEKSDAGAANNEIGIRSGSTWAYGSSYPLSTTWSFNSAMFTVDPATSAQWTASATNSLVFGCQVV